MHERLWKQEPRDRFAAVPAPSNGLGWLWIAVAVCSALLLTGWPMPQGAGGSTLEPRAFQLFPGAFADRSAPPQSIASTSPAELAPTADRSRLSFQAPGGEPTETHEQLQWEWTAERVVSQPAVVTAPAPSVPQNSAPTNSPQTDAPATSAPPATVSAPAAETVAEPAAEQSEPLAGAPPSPLAPVSGSDPATLAFTAREFSLFDAMNQERIANGLPALISKDVLTEVARARSEEMTRLDYFAHFYPGGTSAYEFLQRAGASFSTAGENLAKVAGGETDSVNVAIEALMASPTHRANILNPDFARVGVGAVTSDEGVTIFTMIYADR